MPLPSTVEAEQMAWPPKALSPYFDQLREWSAWYSGKPDELGQFYESYSARVDSPRNRPSQYRGGVVGAASRWFWGQPQAIGEKRTKLHAPLPADIATTGARLLFSEPPSVKLPDDRKNDKTTAKRLTELVDDGLHAALREGAEVGGALSGVYLRILWDKEVVPDRPWISPVHADGAIPEWTYDKLKAVTFWRVLEVDGQRWVRHLERHERGLVWHSVYEGTANALGRILPLNEREETKGLAEQLGESGAIETGIDKLTVVYVPNIKPSRQWRNIPACAHCGRSDFSGAEQWFDALDETYTSWMRDIRLAKARLVVPESYLQTLGPGKGAYFDLDQELYEAVRSMPGPGLEMQAHQFAIRVEEHDRSAVQWTKLAISAAGYSDQSFGLHGDVAVTATEVAARERESFMTRDDKILYWRPAVRDLLETLLLVDKTHFGSGVDPVRPDLTFGDSVSPDPKSVAETLNLLEQARAASIDTKVRMLHPEWEDARVAKEVEGIKEEQGLGKLEDPGTFRGDAPPSTVDKVGNMPGNIPEVDQEGSEQG